MPKVLLADDDDVVREMLHPREVHSRKPYELPILRKLTSEQATLFLVGQAYIGHRGARILLELLFPEPNLQDDLRPNP